MEYLSNPVIFYALCVAVTAVFATWAAGKL